MTPCPATHLGTPCQLEAGHLGDHLNSHQHANATHTIAWTDEPDELLTHGWRRK